MTAFCDYLTRHLCSVIDNNVSKQQHPENGNGRNAGWSSEKGGQVTIDKPGPQVLPRSSVVIFPDGGGEETIELRFCVSLPAQGSDTAIQFYGLG